MSDPVYRPYSPVSATPYGEADPQRVNVSRLEPIFEHFCAVCGAGAPFGFGGDFAAGVPGLWSCAAHREPVERRWKRT